MIWDKLAEKRSVIKSDMLVVGVDIGKYIHVARARFPDGSFTRPLSFTSDYQGFTRFLTHVIDWQHQAACTDVIIGLESTGVYWESLAYWLADRHYRVVQVNPLHVHRSKELLDNTPTKTDDKDSLLIADLVAQGKYLSFVMPRGVFAELRQLASARARLAVDRTTQINCLHVLVSLVFPEFASLYRDLSTKVARRLLYHFSTPQAVCTHTVAAMARKARKAGGIRLHEDKLTLLKERAQTAVGIKEGQATLVMALRDTLEALDALDRRIASFEAQMASFLSQVEESQYLLSLHGVGAVSAAVVLGETGGLNRYGSAEAILKLAGLNLCEISSGVHKGNKHISRRGRPLLRQTLYFIALHHTQEGTPLYEHYARMVNRGVPKPKALVALSCRVMRIMYALVRDRRCFTDQTPGRTQAA
jgi:transposase